MRLESIKKDSQLVLAGVKFDVQWTDGSVAQVTATDAAGNVVVFKKESYDFRVLVRAAPKMVKRHQLTGTVAGLPVAHVFEDRYEADEAKRNYERRVADPNDCVLDLQEIEVADLEFQ